MPPPVFIYLFFSIWMLSSFFFLTTSTNCSLFTLKTSSMYFHQNHLARNWPFFPSFMYECWIKRFECWRFRCNLPCVWTLFTSSSFWRHRTLWIFIFFNMIQPQTPTRHFDHNLAGEIEGFWRQLLSNLSWLWNYL